MAKKIPQVWLDWILENVSLGVDSGRNIHKV